MNSMMGRFGAAGAGASAQNTTPGSVAGYVSAGMSAAVYQKPPPVVAKAIDQPSTKWYNTATITSYSGGPSYKVVYGYSGNKVKVLAESSEAYFLSDGYAGKKSVLNMPFPITKPGNSLWKGYFHKIEGPDRKRFNYQKPPPERNSGGSGVNPGISYFPPAGLPSVMDQGLNPVPEEGGPMMMMGEGAYEEPSMMKKLLLVGILAAVLGSAYLAFGKKGKDKKETSAIE